ncbi:sodium-dependent dopamine transporter-like [Haliotis rufescens]|uniref:sodium-dependent dopamine transporter-like n=1 Tax=Haliotis rufescens TaxID=6454 RepID=UPI00201E7FA5|nr:sodium-dependent dopamine transporter-like [Haliotis rufescens]
MDVQEEGTVLSTHDHTTKGDNHENHEDVNLRKTQWSNKFQGILALLGFSVGLGNLWRFPYLCQRNGGGAFLIPYVISTAVVAVPLFILEVALGQFSAQGPIKVWAICPLMKGVGFCILFVTCIVVPYYSMVFAWALYYLYSSFSTVLPWTTCDNSWNTLQCTNVGAKTTYTDTNNTEYTSEDIRRGNSSSKQESPRTFGHTSTEEFWQ